LESSRNIYYLRVLINKNASQEFDGPSQYCHLNGHPGEIEIISDPIEVREVCALDLDW